MTASIFVETTEAHQARIGLSLRRTKNLRRILTLKRAGKSTEEVRQQMGDSNATWFDIASSTDALAHELHVTWNGQRYVADGYQAPAIVSQTVRQIGQLAAGNSNKRALAEAGYLLVIPYGYELGPLNVAVPVPAQAAAVQFSVQLLCERLSQVQIAEELNYLDYVAPLGGKWTGDAVREIIRRLPVYAGYALYRGTARKKDYWHGDLFAGRQAPLITWDDVKEVLDGLGRENEWTIVIPRQHWDDRYDPLHPS